MSGADREYGFDVKLFAIVRVTASSEEAARNQIKQSLDCCDANLGAWPNGDPILCELSIDDLDNDDLVEIDGEGV